VGAADMHRVDEFQEQNIPQQRNRRNENATECQKRWNCEIFQIAKSGHEQPTATPQESLPHHRSSYKLQRATTQQRQQ